MNRIEIAEDCIEREVEFLEKRLQDEDVIQNPGDIPEKAARLKGILHDLKNL